MYVMGASSSNPEHRRVAAQAQRMAAELRSFAERQSSSRQAQVGGPGESGTGVGYGVL
jgi:hypothetical protein